MINPDLMQQLLAFRRERDWEQLHTFKNLAVSISLKDSKLPDTVHHKCDICAEFNEYLLDQFYGTV